MRIFFLILWCLVPVIAIAYHLGPGQRQLALDNADGRLAYARAKAAKEDWTGVIEACDAALATLPKDRANDARWIMLERAKAKMQNKQLPEANQELESLADDLRADSNADPHLKSAALDALANSQYYLTWLMRLEGKSQEEWEPEIDAARQTYRLLAEEAAAAGQEEVAQKHREDLESAVRLARMDLGELQGLPLPSQ